MKCAINLVVFQRFDSGTEATLLGKAKFVTLADVLCIQIGRVASFSIHIFSCKKGVLNVRGFQALK